MFVGLPIVTTVDGEVREIVEANKVGLFAGAENPEGLARAMEQVHSLTAEERQVIRERGRDYIDREGDRIKLARRFYGYLKELVKR